MLRILEKVEGLGYVLPDFGAYCEPWNGLLGFGAYDWILEQVEGLGACCRI